MIKALPVECTNYNHITQLKKVCFKEMEFHL